MKDKGLISFFEVKQCGFYKNGSKDEVPIDGALDEILEKFCAWVDSRDFIQTIPWDVSSHQKRTQIYCKSIAHDETTKDTLLVLWKRFGDDSGKVSGISPDAKVGVDSGDSIQLDSKVKGQSAILGQPMYYWIIPSLDIIATVNFPHSSAATFDVCQYLKRCMDYRIDHPSKKVTEKESEHPDTGMPIIRKNVTYWDDGANCNLKFKLSASTKEINSDRANADVLANRITHIVIRDTISTFQSDDKDALFKLWSKVNKKKKFSKNIELVESANLTPDEVSEILKIHEKEYNPSNKWINIGFRESENDSTKWFHKYVTKEHIFLPYLDRSQNYYPAKVVLDKILKKRDEILLQLTTNYDLGSDNYDKVVGGE
ncbi:Uncharacterised protein [BD1-7 clade bacterium]|uniref:Uncharacterized protein n=1 Tax=BD1-7 clade bacterium TaxID=2029982 RepID=A0A5S9Q909_9GAMM|nr:Uncharacterised protein [BD1-7 clade bacterium]CAA0113765.1 Uncharacterised protein [BD1-7 clade bacterium]